MAEAAKKEKSPKAQRGSKSFARRLGVDQNADFEERKLMVLREAARCFVEKGVQQTSIDDIAARLNVTKPTIYHYVGSKDGIVRECLNVGGQQMAKFMGDLDAQNMSGLETLKALFRSYAPSVADDFSRCLILIDPKALKPESKKDYGAARRGFIQQVSSPIQRGIDDGSIRPVDVNMAALSIIGSFNFIAQWYRADGPITPDQIADHFLDVFEKGLKA